ncbi:MAG: Stp1/IreP family PP2C-type Ser/Thr phosphatase [Acidimicrobiia bacterium]
MTRFAWGALTDTGRVRKGNEDAYLAVDGLFAVADGMGGHQAGEVASHLALESLQSWFGSAGTDVMVAAVEHANADVVERSLGDPELAGMGTTLVAMALVDAGGRDAIGVVNVGDSRLYLMSDGGLTQITEDHSLVATMVRQGRLTEAEAAVHPQRNILTRALGLDGTVLVDSWEILPVVGDRYLVCSDGLFNEVDDNRIAATLRRLADPAEACRELVRLANEAGGRDNITCVVVDVVDDDGRDLTVDPAVRNRSSPTGGDPVAPAVGSDASTSRRRRSGSSPRSKLTWRVAAFVGAVALVVLIALGFVWWTGTKTWFVGVNGEQVAIFHGKPGGVLWIQPTVAEDTELTVGDVPAARLLDVQNGVEQPSLSSARAFVERLIEQRRSQGTTATSTTSTSTTTVVR